MIGSAIGAYRVVSQLGAGGMGVVYKALDHRLQRHVALKVLPAAVSTDERRRKRFLQEARAASALNDPHIITIFDIFEHEGTDVLVMELVDGRTLRDAMKAPLAVGQALDWTRQIAEALGVAHGAGIVHRDLKPGNVMVTGRDRVKVLDFGLAKVAMAADEATVAPETASGDVLGTVEYMAPEQARGRPVDHRADIYALGTILYEMLAGRRPFAADNRLALLQDIAHGTPVPLRAWRPDLSEALEDVVMRALAREPQLRFQSMWEFASALKFVSTAVTEAAQTGASATPGFTFSDGGPGRALSAAAPASAHPSPTSNASAAIHIPHRRWLYAAGVLLAMAALVALGLFLRRGPAPSEVASERVPAVPVSSGSPSGSQVPSPPTSTAAPRALAPSEPATPLEGTERGRQLVRRFDLTGNVDRAIASFEAAIAQDKAYAPAWAGLARAYWRKQRETRDASWAARALDAATQAVALDQYLADAHVSLGLVMFVRGDAAAARQSFERALVLDPTSAGAHRGLGNIDQAASRFDEARARYTQALGSDPGDWDLMWLQGEIDFQTGQYASAVQWFERSAEAAPDSPVPYRLLGAAHHMLGDYAAAAAAFQKSIGLQPTAAGYTNLGTALFFQGHYRESIQAFERAVELQPSNPLQWGNLADAYRFVPGNVDQAKDAYAHAIQLSREQLAKDPAQTVSRSRLAVYLAKAGDTKEALDELGKVLKPDTTDVNTMYRAAITYELAGRRDEALAMLERALERGYGPIEIRNDPELARLRTDVRYHRLIARFEKGSRR